MVDYLAEAFKALDDVEDVMPCLHEEMFTVDSDGLSELADFEVESEKAEDKKRVIDPDAKNEEELKSSYVGKVIIDCNQCHSKIYKDKEDIVIDGEDANKEEECPYCFATEGMSEVNVGTLDYFNSVGGDHSNSVELATYKDTNHVQIRCNINGDGDRYKADTTAAKFSPGFFGFSIKDDTIMYMKKI